MELQIFIDNHYEDGEAYSEDDSIVSIASIKVVHKWSTNTSTQHLCIIYQVQTSILKWLSRRVIADTGVIVSGMSQSFVRWFLLQDKLLLRSGRV